MLAFAPAFADWVTGSEDHLDLAIDRAELVLESRKRIPWTDCWAHAGLALAAAKRGDVVVAERAYEGLAGLTGSLAELPLAVDHLLGLLARTIGREAAAIGHFEAALAFLRPSRLPARLRLGMTT